MPLVVACGCGKSLTVPDALVGKNVRCPACQKMFTVEGADGAASEDALAGLMSAWEGAQAQGRELPAKELCRNRPELAAELERRIQILRHAARLERAQDRATSRRADESVPHSIPAGGPMPLPAVPGYEILGELGRGGMGVVYKARHRQLNRVVALKMILSGAQAGRQQLARFQLEARAVAKLQHPGIVQVFDVGEHDGKPFLSLEFVEGGSLAGKIQGNPWPPQHAAEIVVLLARAMEEAHRHGIVHRDLKPANVLLGKNGQPKITDFGLAKNVEGESGQTASGTVVGTPSYMAPEQALGLTEEIGPRSDVYALGAILYELLTGRPPFKGASIVGTLRQVTSEEPLPPRLFHTRVPVDLNTICLKALHKEPPRRYASAAALADDLGRFLAGEPIEARPVGRVERAVKWVRRRPVVAGLLALLVLVTLGGLAGITWAYAAAVRQRDAALEANRRRVRAQVEQARHRRTPGGAGHPRRPRDAARRRPAPAARAVAGQKPERVPAPHARGLALVSVEPAAVRDELAAWLMQAEDPAEVILVRDALVSERASLRERFWTSAQDARTKPAASLRALAALAAFDPNDQRWQQQAQTATDQLLAANPLHLGTWAAALRPVRAVLQRPLFDVYRTARGQGRREVAATVLADYADDQPEVLTNLLLDADARQFAVLFARLRTVDAAARLLDAELDRKPAADWTDSAREALAKRQANAAAALLRLGHAGHIWPLFRHAADSTRRSDLVARLAAFGVDARLIAERLLRDDEPDVSARRGADPGSGRLQRRGLPGGRARAADDETARLVSRRSGPRDPWRRRLAAAACCRGAAPAAARLAAGDTDPGDRRRAAAARARRQAPLVRERARPDVRLRTRSHRVPHGLAACRAGPP